MSESKMTVSNARMEAFIETICHQVLMVLSERSDDILKAWHENIEEAEANEKAFPPLRLAISASVDLEAATIETGLRFTATYQSSLKSQLPDPDQPDLFETTPAEASMAKKLGRAIKMAALPAASGILPTPLREGQDPGDEKPRNPKEEAAYQLGRGEFSKYSDMHEFNPYDEDDEDDLSLHEAYRDGWNDKRMERMHQECVVSILEATKGKIPDVLERIERACVTAEEFIVILVKAHGEEARGKAREWLGLKLSKAISEAKRVISE